jgi:hypothetical protein
MSNNVVDHKDVSYDCETQLQAVPERMDSTGQRNAKYLMTKHTNLWDGAIKKT